MSFLASLFNNKPKQSNSLGVKTEFHSHLLPNLDDGVKSFDESIQILKEFEKLGVTKLITTPHIMYDFYRNTPESILNKLDEFRKVATEQNISIQLEAAAEYYLDEFFIKNLEQEIPLLTLGDKFVLFETSYINESNYFISAVFDMKSQGYKPILAHPERYNYLYGSFKKFEEMYDKGVYFQLNINSIGGYYGKEAKKFAEKLIDQKMVDFIGSDCHGMRHMDALYKSIASPYYEKLLHLKLMNDQL